MSEDDEAFEFDSLGSVEGEFVPVFFARNIEEAEEYCHLLSDHEIPARAGVDGELPSEEDPEHHLAGRRGMTHGVPVLVPETLLDEASEIIADREEFSEFEEDDEEEEEEEDDESFGLEGLDSEEEEALLDDEEEDPLLEEDDAPADLDDDDEDELC